ncbi:hypothetical protein AVME950_02530 [Acidovorax sp. SUPP950]|uniref:DUF551 domain-containing protein n=1 Tax=Acidovorax sp. SUPP950 TaxID=511901 RepID=UPI0023CF12A9|nr:DUF551 domain-containing protein [Acidovorax sp. SUPP950]GKS73724.1 hypothetical protein AVME950_02530 [Acidovorax sp. SUPP950]
MADTKSTDHARWKFNALYADTEIRSAADDKLLAVVHAGPEQARIVSLLKGAPQPNAALADGWISVEDRLPDGGVEVLCSGVGWGEAFVMACYYDEERREWYSVNTHWTDATGNTQYPTHWRPLPPPPTLNASKEAGNG